MADTPTQLGQDPQYQAFLYAPVGKDQHGSNVTVLSMLARLGVDPWGEASELASLPDGPAQQRLEALMARFADVSSPVPDWSGTVMKLLAFLPRQAKTARSSSGSTSARLVVPSQGAQFYWIVTAALLLGWVTMLAQGQ